MYLAYRAVEIGKNLVDAPDASSRSLASVSNEAALILITNEQLGVRDHVMGREVDHATPPRRRSSGRRGKVAGLPFETRYPLQPIQTMGQLNWPELHGLDPTIVEVGDMVHPPVDHLLS
jgi:hypothetical protein